MSEFFECFLVYLKINTIKIKWVFIFAFFLFVIYYCVCAQSDIKKHKKKLLRLSDIILLLNCSFVFVMTLFERRPREEFQFKLKPFQSYYRFFLNGETEILLQIIMNIAMYIPLGFLLPCCFKQIKKCGNVLLLSFLLSMGIELIQGFLKIGSFEVDDIINNVLGSAIGVGVYTLYTNIKQVIRFNVNK